MLAGQFTFTLIPFLYVYRHFFEYVSYYFQAFVVLIQPCMFTNVYRYQFTFSSTDLNKRRPHVLMMHIGKVNYYLRSRS